MLDAIRNYLRERKKKQQYITLTSITQAGKITTLENVVGRKVETTIVLQENGFGKRRIMQIVSPSYLEIDLKGISMGAKIYALAHHEDKVKIMRWLSGEDVREIPSYEQAKKELFADKLRSA